MSRALGPAFCGIARGAVLVLLAAGPVLAVEDVSTWGSGSTRNQVSTETGILPSFDAETVLRGRVLDVFPLRWKVRLGTQTYGNPVVAGGRIYVGTNNGHAFDPRFTGNRAVFLCFRESDGRLLWHLNLEHVRSNDVSICSPPVVEGDRVYLVTNRGEVVCLDAKGMSDGNDGPFRDEVTFSNRPQRKVVSMGSFDADIIWEYQIPGELDVAVHGASAGSPILLGERLYVNTSNGIDGAHARVSRPGSPALIALDKHSGNLLGVERSGISKRTLHGSWSSPSIGEVDGISNVIFGGGDGWCYGFDPVPVPDADGGGVAELRELWRFDCNPRAFRFDTEGRPRRPRSREGPSEVIGSPVFDGGRVYVAVGRDLEDGPGHGAFSCYAVSGRGDITESGRIWQNRDVGRTVSTAAVAGGLCYVGDLGGTLHCIDAMTGETLWTHDTGAGVVASPLVVDDTVIVVDTDGIVHILRHDRRRKVMAEVDFGERSFMTPVAANGRLYIATQHHLYALGGEEEH